MEFKMDRILNDKGGKTMKRKGGKKSAYILGLLTLGAFALIFQLGTVRLLAQAQCSNQAQDADCDGFSNDIENGGISLTNGMSLNSYPAPQNPTCVPNCTSSGGPRDQCVDPKSKDLFVIIQRATGCPTSSICTDPCAPTFGGSDIPMPPYDTTYRINLLALIYLGLGVTTHELIQSPGNTSQLIGPQPPAGGWYAVKVFENLDPCSTNMGQATFAYFPAPPSYTGGTATVWPEKIKNWIRTTCSAACFDLNGDGIAETCYRPNDANVASFTCKNGNPNSTTSVNMRVATPDLSKLNGEFIQNIVSHETSHMIHLASGSGTSADHHWPIAYGYLMEQMIGTKATKDHKDPTNINVILYISTGYTRQDRAQYLLE